MKCLQGKVRTCQMIVDTVFTLSHGQCILAKHQVRDMLRKELDCSWKRPESRPIQAFSPEVVENRRLFRAFMRILIRWQCRFVFIDEVSFNP